MNVKGFKGAAVQAAMRYKNRPDVGLIAASEPVSAAGVFTTNLVCAAPVLWCREHVADGRAVAILVNAGQANACTGTQGMENARTSAKAAGEALGCSETDILLCSTGVIGNQLNMPPFLKAIPELVSGLSEEGLDGVARAMMTTDTMPKTAQAAGEIDGKPFTVAGMAKGSGMIAPNMATMLAFVLTDAAVSPAFLSDVLKHAAEMSFNRITVDGDTSTNDTVLALASGQAGNSEIQSEASSGAKAFQDVFGKVMYDLAKLIALDGEGATKLVRVAVSGAADDGQAKMAAMSVANSPLVKTALFGEDANWGRIMMALGKSGAAFDQYKVDVSVNDAPLVRQGLAAGGEDVATAIMKKKEFDLNINLNAGAGQAEVLTCDFSFDYIKINADYRS